MVILTHQGEMRFGAENRIFVVMVNMEDMSQSWKMKREFDIIEPKLKTFLDNFDNSSSNKLIISLKAIHIIVFSGIIFIKNL